MVSVSTTNIADRFLISLGSVVRKQIGRIGLFFRFLFDLLKSMHLIFLNFHTTVDQMYRIGITSIPLVVTTSIFTGGVTAWQVAYQFAGFVPAMYIGLAVGQSVMLEVGPVLTALVVAGRIGASMCSELGTMAVTEQLDAMKCLGLNPHRYLLAPRVFAAVIMLPVLTIFASFVAIMGGFLVANLTRDLSFEDFFFGVRMFYSNWDMAVGLIKSIVFGIIISTSGTYFGYNTIGGAEGVGKSTKASVVVSMTSILISSFLVSKLLLN